LRAEARADSGARRGRIFGGDFMKSVRKGLSSRLPVAGIAGALLISAGMGFAFAAGGNTDTTPTCNQGWVWDEKKKECVQQQSGVVPDKALSDYAYALTQEGRYQEALDVLALMQDPNTPEALNYKGYATRKLGRIDEGIGYYLQSVSLDADYTLVREYLGEAYIQLGRVDLARDQLAEIEKRCGTTCEPYVELDAAINAAL
jgi:tetratricopeptide (TPR) repeat protein